MTTSVCPGGPLVLCAVIGAVDGAAPGVRTRGDFGGASGSLQYSDLKEAHTTHATLIDAGQVHAGEGFDDIKALEAHRARLSHQRSEADIARDALRTREAELAEEARRARLARRDELGAAQQARLGGLLTYGA